MYKEHEALTPPLPDATLWRYMDFTKFVSLLEKQALFFARADKLEDPFEGYWPTRNREAIRPFFEELSIPNPRVPLQSMRDVIKVVTRFMLINCWHESPHESSAMWKLYSKDDSGIAIKTDFDSFAKSFTTSQDIFIGKVSYINYEIDSLGGRWWFRAFLCKRKSFEHEHEVRAIVQIPLPGDQNEGKEGVIDLSQDICDVGNHYKVDLSLLIQEVIVSPYAPNWHLELVQSVAARYDLKAPVVKSRLGDSPTWD